MSKPRSDSVLKLTATNSPEFGEKIIEWLLTPKTDGCIGGIKYAREQLAADGIAVSERALSEFWSWWQLKDVFVRADQKTTDFEELLAKKFPEMDPKRIQEFGQAFFTMQAAASGNAEEYREMEKLRLSKEKDVRESGKLQFDKDKWELETAEKMLDSALRAKADEINSSNLSNAEKIKAMRDAAFADIDALAASGEVVIPK